MFNSRNVLRTLLWDPLEPTATRPLTLVQDASLYCYEQAASTGDLVQPVQWSGEMHDDDFALVYYNYHYYNPKDGR